MIEYYKITKGCSKAMDNISIKDFLKTAASVKPSKRQLDWFDTEFYCFVHFSPNTYTDLEWGYGNEDPAIFNPVKLDCDQWVEAIKSAGMKGMVLTAKHHDGFCLWNTKYTEHSIKNSPLKIDIVKEASEACRRGGIKFGFYLSPWDRNSKLYGTPEYNDYYKAQLTELLTNYGEIFYVWFDGACGEGPNGRKQEYDFPGYIELIRKYQPNAVIFNDFGPDVRWCGNESGTARYAEWSVVPSELCFRSEIQTPPSPMAGDLSYMYNPDNDIGSLSNIIYSKGLVFAGSEIDMSIRRGWFWHENEDPHSLERLFNTYIGSVGANTGFNLNVPPNRDGLFDERDIARLREFGELLRTEFANEIKYESETVVADNNGQCIIDLKLDKPANIKYVVLQEDIAQGQRVETFIIQGRNEYGEFDAHSKNYKGTCIGHKKICRVNMNTDCVRIFVTSARDTVNFRSIKLY